jgi:DNA-binding NarL/FixJ family response regulator
MQADAVSCLLLDIYSVPLSPQSWTEALRAATLFACVEGAALVEVASGGIAVLSQHGLSPAFADKYPRFAPLDPVLTQMRSAPPVEVSLWNEREAEPSPFRRGFLAPLGLRYWAGILLLDDPDRQLVLLAYRGPGAVPFSAEDETQLRALAPHLQQIAALVDCIERRDARLAFAESAIDTISRGIVEIDRLGRIVRANASARRIISSNAGIVARGDELRARRVSDDRRLRAIISAAFDAADARGNAQELRPIMIAKPGTNRSYIVRAQPIAREGCFAKTVLVSIRDPLPQQYEERTISEFMGFTAAEARIAQRLVQGMTITEVARVLGVSPNTVRTHVRSMFVKANVKRQVDLVRVMTQTLGRAEG